MVPSSFAAAGRPVGNQLEDKTRRFLTGLLLLAAFALPPGFARYGQAAEASASVTILKAEEAARLVPATVFFRGQVASVQARNAGGVKLADGMVVLAALVDTSGYSTAVQQKYQAYLITEVTLTFEGGLLVPGTYGVGFLPDNKFVVMDVGAHDVITATSHRDAELKRPTPLQILGDKEPGRFRLYVNRNYVVLSRFTGD